MENGAWRKGEGREGAGSLWLADAWGAAGEEVMAEEG